MAKRRPLSQNASKANPVAYSNGNLQPSPTRATQIPKSLLAQIQLPATQLSDPNRADSSAANPMAESFNANTEVSGLKNHIPNFPRLATRTFPDATGKQIRCTSYGQALYSLPGSKLIPQETSKWFSIFFQGLDNPLFFPYTESEHFENPVSFRLDSFADDTSTRQLYSIMIHPCFLPVGMSTSNRIIKPGYESYQPVVAARQFGLGQVSPHFFLHFLTESRADLPDVLTSQRCYSFFDALVIPIPHNLSFTSSTDDFEAWWAMWKTHAFRRALGPLLKQLDAEYDIPAEQQQDGPEPVHDDGSSFTLHPPAPVVLFCKNSPSLKKVVMQSQPILPKSAPKSGVSSRPAAPRAPAGTTTSTEEISSEDTQSSREDSSSGTSGENTTPSQPDLPPSASKKRSAPEPASSQASPKAGQGGLRTKSRCIKRARKTPQTSSSDQELSNTDDTSSGEVKEVVMPSTTLDLATSKSGVDKAAILATPSAETQEPIAPSSAAPMVLGKGYDLSNLLTFDPEFIEPSAKASEESGPSATQGQLQRFKALLSSSIETLVEDTEGIKSILEDLQPHLPVKLQVKLGRGDFVCLQELEDLEERVRVTKQLIQDKEALIARSHEEAEGLKAELKTDLAEIRALNKQLVTGQDEDDEAEIAEDTGTAPEPIQPRRPPIFCRVFIFFRLDRATRLNLSCASNELWRIILEGFKPYNPDKLTRREAVDSQLNNTALHMIQTSVGTQELPRVRNYTTAKEAWDGLAASCMGSESTRRNKYNALRNQAEGFMRLPDEDHQVMYGRLLIVADAFRLSGATHINDSWIKEKYIECMMPFVPIDVKTLVGRECYSSLSSQDAVHEMQALKVLEQNSHDSRNRAIGMAKGNNLALVVNPVEEVYPQEQYRASWSMSYPEDLECHYHDHMAFHAKSFWVDPSKAKEDNIKRNHKSGFTSFGPKTRSCYNCDDKRHFIAECPYENRELHNGRLIPKDKSKESKGKYSKAPNKKFYNNKTKKGKRPPRVVLVTREEYSSDEVESSSDDEGESSKEVAAIVTTNIPSSSLFESPNENPHIKNAHCFMAKSSLDTSIVLSTQEEYSSGDDDVDDEEDATSNGLVALASLSTNSSSPSESPNEIIHVEEESCLMAKSSEVSSPSPSMPNISSDLGVDDASLKVKQEMLEFDEFMFNLQGINKKHVSNLMARLAQQNDMLEKKGQIEREDSLEIHALKNALEESQETIASLEERLENLEEPQDEINKLTKARDHARAKTKLLKKEMAQFGVDHEKLVKDLDELDKAHKALKSEYSLLSKSNEQLQIRLASYDVPSSSTPSCDHANIIEENARLKDELAKASSPQSKLSLDDLLSKQRSNNGKEGLGYNAKAKKANKQKAKPAQEKKKAITNGEAPKGNTINDDNAGNANPHYDYAAGGSKWVLDSGCTSHMTGGKNLVKELRPNINNITVSFGDNSTSEVMGFGKVVVAHNITLVDVMLVLSPESDQARGGPRSRYRSWHALRPSTARDREALRAVAPRDRASRSPSHSGSTVLAVAARRWVSDANTFWHARWDTSSTTTISPSTSEMAKDTIPSSSEVAEETPVTYGDLTGELKKKYDEIKSALEADLIGSFHRTRSHGIRWKGFTPEGALDGVDLSTPSENAPGRCVRRSTSWWLIRCTAILRAW
ncbi:hypothetical protein QYE76_033615 [Lolium multiflorum]|uniref:Retrovirus-related Pol polyprotein from transposon TNT 1-94-like beta-barrel domain-containing protein n=1 Tax=Lolium multiflorum TaxID=4521 RepID=A0AAD8QXR1_LOLMU|nr:hypothetical protein QYE76_033615 [Lolium multiflorum]